VFKRFVHWFTQPDSPLPLAWFRILVAAFCLVNIAVIRDSIMDVYGQYGFVQWAITRVNLYPGLPHIGDFALLLARWGFTPDQTVWLFMGFYVLALCGLLVGFASRLMAILAWFIHFLWMHAGGGLIYGMDIFVHIALFYCMIMPVGAAISLDARRARLEPVPSVAAGVTRKMLQLHMCIIYLSAGLEKAAGVQWWNGEAVWRALILPVFHQFDFGWLAWVPWLPMILGWPVMVIETGYAVFMWLPKMRRLWFALVVGMHLGIGLFLGMWLFAGIMIVLNVGAFGWEVLQDVKASSKGGRSTWWVRRLQPADADAARTAGSVGE